MNNTSSISSSSTSQSYTIDNGDNEEKKGSESLVQDYFVARPPPSSGPPTRLPAPKTTASALLPATANPPEPVGPPPELSLPDAAPGSKTAAANAQLEKIYPLFFTDFAAGIEALHACDVLQPFVTAPHLDVFKEEIKPKLPLFADLNQSATRLLLMGYVHAYLGGPQILYDVLKSYGLADLTDEYAVSCCCESEWLVLLLEHLGADAEKGRAAEIWGWHFGEVSEAASKRLVTSLRRASDAALSRFVKINQHIAVCADVVAERRLLTRNTALRSAYSAELCTRLKHALRARDFDRARMLVGSGLSTATLVRDCAADSSLLDLALTLRDALHFGDWAVLCVVREAFAPVSKGTKAEGWWRGKKKDDIDSFDDVLFGAIIINSKCRRYADIQFPYHRVAEGAKVSLVWTLDHKPYKSNVAAARLFEQAMGVSKQAIEKYAEQRRTPSLREIADLACR